MVDVHLHLPASVHAALWDHLLPERFVVEQAAFLYAKPAVEEDAASFRFVAWDPIPPEGFAVQSRHYLELSDETKAAAIKRAHDLAASLVEVHSHVTAALATFSASDLAGFEEFVPHVWWRLKGRPYLAMVVSKSSFDAFAWVSGPEAPSRLTGIFVDRTPIFPTGLSRLSGSWP